MLGLSQLDNSLEQIQTSFKSLSVGGARAESSHIHGLWSLPRDMLIRIIELVGTKKNGRARCEANRTIQNLSLVSRSFRELVIDALDLWTTLDHAFCSPCGFETRISRTKNAHLTLNVITWKIADGELLPTLANAFSVRDRYRKVEIRFARAEGILEVYPVLDFPEAEKAFLHFYGEETAWRKLLKSWTFPKLTKLELIDGIPAPGLFTHLTEFRLRTEAIDPPELAYDILHGLTRFLAHLQRLETLSVDIRGTSVPSVPVPAFVEDQALPPIPGSTDFQIVDLPTVKSFYLSNYSDQCGEGSVSSHVLASLFRSIRVPNATDVRLRVTFQYDEDMTDCLAPFAKQDVASSVSHLSIASPVDLDRNFLVDFLHLFPNVESLEIEIPSLVSTVESMDEGLLNLQRLRLLTVHSQLGCHIELEETHLGRLTTRKERVILSYNTGMSTGYLDDFEPFV